MLWDLCPQQAVSRGTVGSLWGGAALSPGHVLGSRSTRSSRHWSRGFCSSASHVTEEGAALTHWDTSNSRHAAERSSPKGAHTSWTPAFPVRKAGREHAVPLRCEPHPQGPHPHEPRPLRATPP